MALVVVLIGVIGMLVLLSVWRGFLLSILWGWFMVPLGLPNISIALAIGIASTVGMLEQTPRINSKEEEGDGAKTFVLAFMVPLITLGVGWIAHQFT